MMIMGLKVHRPNGVQHILYMWPCLYIRYTLYCKGSFVEHFWHKYWSQWLIAFRMLVAIQMTCSLWSHMPIVLYILRKLYGSVAAIYYTAAVKLNMSVHLDHLDLMASMHLYISIDSGVSSILTRLHHWGWELACDIANNSNPEDLLVVSTKKAKRIKTYEAWLNIRL